MAASEAAVTAVMETLGCSRAPVDWESRGWKSRTKWIKDGSPENFGDICFDHRVDWTARGCPVAVAAADAAVDADRASIQAEALREAAKDARRVADESEAAYQDSLRPYDQGVADAWDAAADGLRDRADRIEGV